MSLVAVKKKGSLYKLPVKGFVKKWNRRWFVLYGTNIDGIVRLEYFDNESCEATAMGKRTIPLRQCSDLSPTKSTKIHPYVFQFTTPLGHHVFAADTHTDMKEWMSAMKEALMEDKQRNRRKKTQSMIAVQQPPERTTPGLSASGTSEVPLTINQPELTPRDNPYEPSNSGTYRVTLELNESAKRLNFTGMIYNLDITPEKITLIAADSGADVAQWQYRQIRTYGKSSGKFNFECGRGANTGPGTFVFKTTCSKEIFGIVHRNIRRIRTEMEQEEAGEREGAKTKAQLPKQTSVPEHLQQAKSPTKKTDLSAGGQPMKPMPYKAKKEKRSSMDMGTYRLSKDFGNPPSYEEVSAAGPVKEKEKPTNHHIFAAHEEQKVPEGLYSTVDKSKKAQSVAKGAEPKSTNKGSTTKTEDDMPTASIATNDPFHTLPATRSPAKQDSSDNPFQLDPFLFSPQSGANSFNIGPGVDPFSTPLPPLNEGGVVNPLPTAFDDLEQLDSPAGGQFDIFNFGLPPIGPDPSANGASNLQSLAENPVSGGNNPSGLNFDLDDRLFDTLAQLEVQDGRDNKEDLTAAKGKRRVNDEFDFSYPQAPVSGQVTGATALGDQQKKMTQQEFDNLWDGICATMPTTDS